MIQLPHSPRFFMIDASEVTPRSKKVAPRPVYVYLPEEATRNWRRRFPVLYCQDGQNIWDDPHCCFGHGGWFLNRVVDELTREGKIEPVILVGIPNSHQRVRDYTPGKSYDEIGGHPYATFVQHVVKRRVEAQFPTRRGSESAALMGSSLGGLVSLWMAHQLPNCFGQAACLSGAFQMKDDEGKSFANFLEGYRHQHLRVYLDAGTIRDGAPQTRKVRDVYLSRGWQPGRDFFYFEDEGGEHNERYWRERVWRALIFLFGTANSSL